MATIELRKQGFDGIASVLDKLGSCFGSYDATIKDLKRTASAVDGSTCDLGEVINDLADSEESKEEKVKRAKELGKKIDTFVNSAVKHEHEAAKEIKKKKKDFYKKYSYLKPDCETFWGKIGTFFKNLGESIGAWVKENVLAIIIAVVIVALAVLAVIFLPEICAILAIVVAAVSAVMGIVDIICCIATGKDFAEWLKDKGHPWLSQIWKGFSWGFAIASLILPIGALEEGAKNTLKEAMKHPFKSFGKWICGKGAGFKDSILGFAKIFADDGFAAGMKALGNAGKNLAIDALKGFVGYDELKNGLSLGKAFLFDHKRGAALTDYAYKLLGLGGINSNNLTGDNASNYQTVASVNNNELTTAVNNHSLSADGAGFSELNYEYRPTSGSDAANALDELRAGTLTGPHSQVYDDMKTSFYNSVKNNDELAGTLLNNTGVDINNCANYRSFERALRDNGFTIDPKIGQAGGKANVDVVPTWAYHATTSYAPGGAMAVRDINNMQGASGYIGQTMGTYNQFVRTKSDLYLNQHMFDVPDFFAGEAKDALLGYTGPDDRKFNGVANTNLDIVEGVFGVNPQTNIVVSRIEALLNL